MVMQIKYKRLPHYSGKNLQPQHFNDAGIDLCYSGATSFDVLEGKINKIPTGICIEIPQGYTGILMERSGMGAKFGMHLLGRVIDSNYRGEIFILATAIESVTLMPGDRVAQLVTIPYLYPIQTVEVSELSDTSRGTSGLGSTGINSKPQSV